MAPGGPVRVPRAGTVALGVAVADPGRPASLDAYIAAAGRPPAIVEWSQSWSEPLFYPVQMKEVAALGAVPLVTWDPVAGGRGVPLSAVAGGRYDRYLRTAARAAASWGRPFFVRFAHEMNVRSSPFGPGAQGNNPAAFVAAWRHVVDLFRAEGATNVSWVWSPNVYCGGRCPFAAFYPGDAWVDWVALDGYNYAAVDHVPWMSLDKVFEPSYDVLRSITSKPVMIAETASTGTGEDKAAWITQGLLHAVPADLPAVRAVVWFDRQKETDWKVDSSPASLAAFRQVVSSALYQGAFPAS